MDVGSDDGTDGGAVGHMTTVRASQIGAVLLGGVTVRFSEKRRQQLIFYLERQTQEERWDGRRFGRWDGRRGGHTTTVQASRIGTVLLGGVTVRFSEKRRQQLIFYL